MTDSRLTDYLDHIREAAANACSFVEGLNYEAFLKGKRTQQAVIMSIIIVGEAATKIMDRHPDFTAAHSNIPWKSMRGMRNRIAHVYFVINLEIVWGTVTIALPKLVRNISAIEP
jgi:uncharacterized protein with HEPN domain